MTMHLFFRHRQTGALYQVLRMDKEKNRIWLKSKETGTEFDEDYSKEKFEKLGYEIVKQVDDQFVKV
jgi:hypothetical protein